MMEILREWIISIVTTVIFVTIVELIIPKGNINKYVRLGTGLLVMVVVLSPIFKILNNNFNLEEGINSYTKSISAYEGVDTKKAQDKFKKSTQESFKESLKKTIVKEVKMKTGKEYIVTKIELKEANNEFDFIGIKYIEIRRQSKDSTVIPVNKVEIGKSSKVEDEGTRDKEVLRILENDFNILSTEVKFLK